MHDLNPSWESSPDEPGLLTADASGRWLSFHVPYAAKVSFEWKVEQTRDILPGIQLFVDGLVTSQRPEQGVWATVELSLPEEGGHVAWRTVSFDEEFNAQIRNISILRRGGVARDVFPDPEPETELDDSDNDGDGYSNLIEWLAGGDRADGGIIPPFQLVSTERGIRYRFKRRLDRGALELFPEVSSDLQSWERVTFPQVRQIDIDAEFETLEVTLADQSGPTFIRLHAFNFDGQ
jgi:hypothetical protein